VAEVLREKPTKLYHHVEALERVGLIRLTETRPNRGTVEKYFQAVAAQFQVAASVSSAECASSAALSAQGEMLSSLLETTRKELLDGLRPERASGSSEAEAPLVARITLRGSNRKVQAARRRIFRLIDSLRTEAEEVEPNAQQGGQDRASFTLTLVFCKSPPNETGVKSNRSSARRRMTIDPSGGSG
jgi:hypothetical protein